MAGNIQRADIVVVGSGLAGSMAAALLGRRGHDVISVDPHDAFPADFRCEKLEQGHMEVLGKTGLSHVVERIATRTDTLWVARFGRLVDVEPFTQYGFAYKRLVDAMRSEVPPGVRICRAWANAIEPSRDRQRVRLSDGREIDARLVVLASGANVKLREALGIERRLTSACHSVTIGFDLRRQDGADFDFPALQYNPERAGFGVGYITLFRIGDSMRANLFLYRPLKSPEVATFRTDPDVALRATFPKLAGLIGDYAVQGPLKVRPTDLHEVRNFDMPGVVVIGDAFSLPCPATGTGTLKIFTDVERLCGHHVPRWLATPGMDADKIDEFYRDPAKVKCDRMSVDRSHRLRAISIAGGLRGQSGQWMRFFFRRGRWALRTAHRRLLHAGDGHRGRPTLADEYAGER